MLLAAGLAFSGDLAFWHTSIQLTSVANSTLLANLASIFVTLAAWMFLRQRPTRLFIAGLAAALAGVALLVHASVQFSATGLLGDALGVVTAMFYAAYLLAVKGLRDRGASTLPLMHAAGQGLIAYALAHLPAAFSSVSLLFQPVMAALFAWLLLAEPLLAVQVAGGVVVLLGIWLARRGSS